MNIDMCKSLCVRNTATLSVVSFCPTSVSILFCFADAVLLYQLQLTYFPLSVLGDLKWLQHHSQQDVKWGPAGERQQCGLVLIRMKLSVWFCYFSLKVSPEANFFNSLLSSQTHPVRLESQLVTICNYSPLFVHHVMILIKTVFPECQQSS